MRPWAINKSRKQSAKRRQNFPTAGSCANHPPPALSFNDVKTMQGLLSRAGYDVGAIDGFMGLKTRQAVKAMQVKYAMPADSYPTAELLARLRGPR